MLVATNVKKSWDISNKCFIYKPGSSRNQCCLVKRLQWSTNDWVMESIFQASLKNNRIYFVFILDVAINSTDLKAESYCITWMEEIQCNCGFSLSFASYLSSLSALSPGGDNCAAWAKQNDSRLILGAEGEVDFCAHIKGDRWHFHKALLGEANCINIL